MPPTQQYAFRNYGGTYQLQINSMDDLAGISDLDEPFWMATSAPTHQLVCDPKVLTYLDHDKNNRILSHDIRTANNWLHRVLRHYNAVNRQLLELNLDDLNTEDADGTRMLTTARRILHNLKRPDNSPLTLADLHDQKAILQQGDRNGDGVIPPDSIEEEDVRTFAVHIMDTVGKVNDLSGVAGVDKAHLERFIACADGLVKWQHAHSAEHTQPLGANTAAACDLLESLKPVIEDFFQLCKVVNLNKLLGRDDPVIPVPPEVFDTSDAADGYLKNAPIARPNANGVLPLKRDLNPCYAETIRRFMDDVVTPLPQLNMDSNMEELTEAEWQAIDASFNTYRSWLTSKSGGEVEKLSLEQLETYLSGDLPQRLGARIDADLAVGAELDAVNDLEKLILLQRWFLPICNNFISFPHLYDPDERAMFEVGRLIIDGRIFQLNIKVTDPNSHAAVAKNSGVYLMYSEITSSDPKEKFFMVTPVTSRRLGRLGINKRGVLFDRDGREWDARVVKVVDNPVSLIEAMMAPFRKIGAMLAGTVQKLTSSAEKQIQTKLTSTGAKMEKGVAEGITVTERQAAADSQTVATAAQGAAAPQGKSSRDLLLAGGVTIAALGSSFAFIAKTIASLKLHQALAVMAFGLGIVLIPVMLIAIYKLYRRNLSAILEASGWAINGRMRLTYRLGKIFAPRPTRPDGFAFLRKDLVKTLAHVAKSQKQRLEKTFIGE